MPSCLQHPAPGAPAGHGEGPSRLPVPREVAVSPSCPALLLPAPALAHPSPCPRGPQALPGSHANRFRGRPGTMPRPPACPCSLLSAQDWDCIRAREGGRKEGSSSAPTSRCWRWHTWFPAFIGDAKGWSLPIQRRTWGFLVSFLPMLLFPLFFFFFYLFKKKKKETVPT